MSLAAKDSAAAEADETDSWEAPAHRSLNDAASNVVRVSDTQRLAHLTTILPITTTKDSNTTKQEERVPVDFRVYNEASAWLAWFHLDQPVWHILPPVRERLRDCDIRFSLEMHDTRFSALHAARELLKVVAHEDKGGGVQVDSGEAQQQRPALPIALVGAARSAVTGTLSFLSSVYGLPQISSSSTAANLDNKDSHPLFGRTVPTNAGDATAYAMYLEDMGITHVGIVYIADNFGTNYHADLVQELSIRGIRVWSVSYVRSTMRSAIQQLKSSGMKYIIGIFNPNTWKPLLKLAFQNKIIGHPGYTWLLTEASAELVSDSFVLNRTSEKQLAKALNGVGVLLIDVPPLESFDTALKRFSESDVQRQRFLSQHDDPSILQNYSFTKPGPSLYQYFTYDAVIALGIAACECPQDLFTGPELYAQLLKTEFRGVSGQVSFNNRTGTRNAQDFQYRIQNLVLSETLSNEEYLKFGSNTAVIVDQRNQTVDYMRPFIYADSTTDIPLPLPALSEDMNLMSPGVRAIGLALGGLVMLTSIGWIVWTLVFRNKDVVRASQPFFLIQLSIGTFIMASAVIPMSLQEPVSDRVLDMACMATPWLISIGFVTAFSALFSKTWRLNKLFKHGKILRRIKVRPRDVMLPFLVLMTINIGLLTAWTLISPLQWERTPVSNFDQFGRSVESYGSCRSSADDEVLAFLVPILTVDIIALIFANYQSYQARNLPTDFSESAYIGMSMVSLLETFIIGVPLLFLSRDNPTTNYLIQSILVSVCCLTIQLPIFLPKYIQRNRSQQQTSQPRIRSITSGRGARMPISAGSQVHISMAGSTRGLVATPTANLVDAGSREFTRRGSITSVQSLFKPHTAETGTQTPQLTGPDEIGSTRVRRSSGYYDQRRRVESSTCGTCSLKKSHRRQQTEPAVHTSAAARGHRRQRSDPVATEDMLKGPWHQDSEMVILEDGAVLKDS